MNNKFIVYKHTNKINNKTYYGITCQNPNKRWKNGLGYQHNKFFFNDIQEYGWDNFNHEILYENLSNEEALQIETNLIIENKTYLKEYGYNVIKETNNPLSYKCANNKGKTYDEIFGLEKSKKIKEKISKSNIGKNNWTANLIVSEETKEKISKAVKKKYDNNEIIKNNSNKQKVKCITDNLEFESLSEAGKYYNLSVTDISNCCKGKYKQLKGKVFEFINRIDNSIGRRKVICIETDEIFNSVKDCANKFNVSSSLICACCKGRRKRIKNHTFQYIS